jgi:hypothetical protein
LRGEGLEVFAVGSDRGVRTIVKGTWRKGGGVHIGGIAEPWVADGWNPTALKKDRAPLGS